MDKLLTHGNLLLLFTPEEHEAFSPPGMRMTADMSAFLRITPNQGDAQLSRADAVEQALTRAVFEAVLKHNERAIGNDQGPAIGGHARKISVFVTPGDTNEVHTANLEVRPGQDGVKIVTLSKFGNEHHMPGIRGLSAQIARTSRSPEIRNLPEFGDEAKRRPAFSFKVQADNKMLFPGNIRLHADQKLVSAGVPAKIIAEEMIMNAYEQYERADLRSGHHTGAGLGDPKSRPSIRAVTITHNGFEARVERHLDSVSIQGKALIENIEASLAGQTIQAAVETSMAAGAQHNLAVAKEQVLKAEATRKRSFETTSNQKLFKVANMAARNTPDAAIDEKLSQTRPPQWYQNVIQMRRAAGAGR